MKTFRCQCGHEIFFENTTCNACGRALGYLPDRGALSALEPVGNGQWFVRNSQSRYRMCVNYAQENVCNWMVSAEDPTVFCRACRLNQVIPNLSQPNHRLYWAKLETAKRRTLYTLLQLGLPVASKGENPDHGLAFAFLADATAESEFTVPIGDQELVRTGHAHGLITINLAEADDIARTRIRERLREGYRTLLGHFRHEVGHCYWDLLINDDRSLHAFRQCFGDDTQDYQQALRTYYENGPLENWGMHYISAYATAHPWEDWAESWAHYLHMIDTLDTAQSYGLTIQGREVASGGVLHGVGATFDFSALLEDWLRLSMTLNALNRSMGLRDAYPFVLHEPVKQKLRFVHDLVTKQKDLR